METNCSFCIHGPGIHWLSAKCSVSGDCDLKARFHLTDLRGSTGATQAWKWGCTNGFGLTARIVLSGTLHDLLLGLCYWLWSLVCCRGECEDKMFKVHISTTTKYFHAFILVFLSAQFRAYCWSHVHLQCWRSVKWSSRTLWIIIDFMLKLLRSHSLDLTFGNLQFWDHTFWNCWHVVCIWYIRVIWITHFELKCLGYSFGFIKWCFVFDILASDVK